MTEYKGTYPDPRSKDAELLEAIECDPDYVNIPRSEYTQLCYAEFCRMKLIRAVQDFKYSDEFRKFACILLGVEVPPNA